MRRRLGFRPIGVIVAVIFVAGAAFAAATIRSDTRLVAATISVFSTATTKLFSLLPKSTTDVATCANGSRDKAIAACTRAIESGRLDNEGLSSVHSLRGVAYSRMDDDERAIADFNEAIRLDPNNAVVFVLRGMSRREMGDDMNAMMDFDEAIRLDPKYGVAFHVRGMARRSLGNLENAIADFSEAIRLDPKEADSIVSRGMALFEIGDHDRAIADFSEAIRRDPNNRDLYQLRGKAWQAKGNMDRARADRGEAMRLMMQ
jgi:tetratricopeptide (TPR) repeat protein